MTVGVVVFTSGSSAQGFESNAPERLFGSIHSSLTTYEVGDRDQAAEAIGLLEGWDLAFPTFIVGVDANAAAWAWTRAHPGVFGVAEITTSEATSEQHEMVSVRVHGIGSDTSWKELVDESQEEASSDEVLLAERRLRAADVEDALTYLCDVAAPVINMRAIRAQFAHSRPAGIRVTSTTYREGTMQVVLTSESGDFTFEAQQTTGGAVGTLVFNDSEEPAEDELDREFPSLAAASLGIHRALLSALNTLGPKPSEGTVQEFVEVLKERW